MVALISSPLVANLTSLDLTGAYSGPEVLTIIAQSAAMSKLERLELDGNRAGDDGVLALAQSTTLGNLTWLGLNDNDFGPEGINALCSSPVMAGLRTLHLDYNDNVGNHIAAALAAPSSTLYSIVELSLAKTDLNDEGLSQLLATSNLDQLNVLQVVQNRISSTKAAYSARFDGRI